MTDLEAIFVLPFDLVSPTKALKKAIMENDQAIIDLNRQQLDRGRDATGQDLGSYKNFGYKNRFKPIDLKLTGDFREKMTLQVDDKETEVFSQDWKYDFLKRFRRKDPLGISAPFIPNMQAIIEPDFVENFKIQLLQ